MYQSPNGNRTVKLNHRNKPFSLGNNNLFARFKKALSILLSVEYYEGSEYGMYYNKCREDGRSQIYVDQPDLEKKLKDEFIDIESDIVKFLVGPTGTGKTTLMRNVFHVFGRDVAVTDNNLVIYVSFYSMVSYSGDAEDATVYIRDALIGAINEAISCLNKKDYIDRLASYDDAYYNDFYNFVKSNNKHLIETVPSTSDNAKQIRDGNGQKFVLDWIAQNKPIDYYMCQLKYELYLYKKHTNSMFNNIILIFDDLESLASKYTNDIVEYAYHCKKCLQANFNRSYHFKVLVTMRNYTYRIGQNRKKEAFREISWEDVIKKDTAPTLSEILDKRVAYVMNLDEVINSVDDKKAFQQAGDSLKIILLRMYGQYDNMLLSLNHNNIFKSMTLIFRILTNKTHMGKYETDRREQNGVFEVSAKDYRVENRSNNSRIPGNDEVFYALAYGEEKLYFDSEDYYLTNIMHYKNTKGENTELLGIYIIQYFIHKGISMEDEDYDGFESLLCINVIEEIMSLYSFSTKVIADSIYRGLDIMMKHLYRGGVLLQSIIEPIAEEDDEVTHRIYKPEMKVFLSLRGSQLYNMLSYNALLFTTYRDDIVTDIEGNNIPTLEMSMSARIHYCLTYIEYLASKEIELFRSVSSYKNYKDVLGSELVVVLLMKGMKETIKTYFKDVNLEQQEIIRQYRTIQEKINDFLDSIYDEEQIDFVHIESV